MLGGLVRFGIDTKGSIEPLLVIIALCFEPIQHIRIDLQRRRYKVLRHAQPRSLKKGVRQRWDI